MKHICWILLLVTSSLWAQNPFQPSKNKKWSWQLSVPYINQFYTAPDIEANSFRPETRVSDTGFMGIGTAIGYHYRPERSINLGFDYAITSELFFPAPIDYVGGRPQFSLSTNIHINQLHHKGKWSFGYGINLSKYEWREKEVYKDTNQPHFSADEDDIKDGGRRTNHLSLGLHLPLYLQLRDKLQVGLVYLPSFYRLDIDPAFDYEHQLRLEFMWKYPIF